MRILAIGDIHGCLNALDALLEVVAPAPDDLLIMLGDYVDRGPDSRGVLDRLIEMQARWRVVPLRGNHDEMMLDVRDGQDASLWLNCGGRQTLLSYGVSGWNQRDGLGVVPAAHWKFLEHDLVDWYETETHFFVHALAAADLPLGEQPTYLLHWEKLVEPVEHYSGKVMVCGHTKQPSGRPLDLGSTVCIDTGAYTPHGWLTCLDVRSGRYWQANQAREAREGRLAGG
jgi:serine/threonine protein phosphatase 1